MTPSQYAARYLPVMVRGTVPIDISRYHLGKETAAKDQLLGALAGHLATNQKKDPGYRLTMNVQGTPLSIGSWKEVGIHLYNPFIGKGSPEECDFVLQLATLIGGIRPERLQAWADANLGLDCNGFVGNYLFHDVLAIDWLTVAPAHLPGPSSLISTIFKFYSGIDDRYALDDLSQVTQSDSYLIARVDANGNVMPGGPGNVPGHIAITEPGQIMQQSFVSNSMGGIDATFAKLDMYNHLALRTVESVGPRNTDPGIVMNWMVFQEQDKTNKRVFKVRRDKILMQDRVKITPI